MCDTCSEFQQFLSSNDSFNELNRCQVLRKSIEVLHNYLQAWTKKQCLCMFSDIKNYERFSSLTQELIYAASFQMKLLLKDVNVETKNLLLKKEAKIQNLNRDEFGNEDKEKLFMMVSKIFMNNFPLYAAFKHVFQSRIDESLHDSHPHSTNFNLLNDFNDPEMAFYFMRNVTFICKIDSITDIANCFHYFGPDKLPVTLAHALCSIVNNLKRWITMPAIVDCICQLKSKVFKYLCKLSDQDLRLDLVKNMADYMWKDTLISSESYDVDSLNLALKYFNSSTLTMRLYGITQINNQITLLAELCSGDHIKESDESSPKMANWLIENNIISQIFGPNLHVELMKQSHIILNFLAMEKRITTEHINIIWQAAQLKHCSKTVYDLLLTFIKNLGITPIMHLYSLLNQLEPKDHTEQTLSVASTIVKFIWSRGNLTLDSRFGGFNKANMGISLPKCNSSTDNSAVSIDASDDDQPDTSQQSADSRKSDDEPISTKTNFRKRFRSKNGRSVSTKIRPVNSDVDFSSTDEEDEEDDVEDEEGEEGDEDDEVDGGVARGGTNRIVCVDGKSGPAAVEVVENSDDGNADGGVGGSGGGGGVAEIDANVDADVNEEDVNEEDVRGDGNGNENGGGDDDDDNDDGDMDDDDDDDDDDVVDDENEHEDEEGDGDAIAPVITKSEPSLCQLRILKKNNKRRLLSKNRVFKEKRPFTPVLLGDSSNCMISSSTEEDDKDSTKAARLSVKRPKHLKHLKSNKRIKSANFEISDGELATESSKNCQPKINLPLVGTFDENKNLASFDESSSSNDLSKELNGSGAGSGSGSGPGPGPLSRFLPKSNNRLDNVKLINLLSADDEADNENDNSFSSQTSNKSEKNMADFDNVREFDGESGCEDEFAQFALQAQLASEQIDLANKGEIPLKLDLNAISSFNLDNVCQPGNTLIWDLLQDNKIGQLSENMVYEAEKTLTNLLCFNCEKNIRVKFIEGCLQNLASNRSVVISLRLLPKLFTTFHQHRNNDKESLVEWAEREHQMMSLFFSNLKTYCSDSKFNNSLSYTSHVMQIQVRLFFLTQIYSMLSIESNLKLTVDQIDTLWKCLADDPECSDELFSWFMTHLKDSEYQVIGADGRDHLYTKLLPTLNPENISMTSLSLLQYLCDAKHSPKLFERNHFCGENGSGLNYMWSIALRAFNTDVSMAAIQYINSYYMRQQNLEKENQFVSQCMSHLKEAEQCLKSDAENWDNSLQRIQRGLLLLKSHLETFRRRYAYHLRRWKIEGQGINSHVPLDERHMLKVNVVVQPATSIPKACFQMQSTDYVADLRAEVMKWWEGVVQNRKQKQVDGFSGSSLSTENTIRLLIQGQELTIDLDERTLADLNFKDNQVVYASMNVLRSFKKISDSDMRSTQPAPNRDFIPSLLLMKSEYFEQLFNLMTRLCDFSIPSKQESNVLQTKSQILSRNVWDILAMIPTNPSLLEKFENLDKDFSFEETLDAKNPQKLIYSLYVVERMILQSRSNADMDTSLLENWTIKFIKKGGFKYLHDNLLSIVLEDSSNYKNEWTQDSISYLLKILYELGTNVSTEDRMSNKLLRRERTIWKFDKDILSSINVKDSLDCLVKLFEEISKPYDLNRLKTSFWGREQTIQQVMSLLIAWIHTSDEIRDRVLQSKNLTNLLIRLVLEDPDPSVRNETCSAIYYLCLGHSDRNNRNQFLLTMTILSELLKCLSQAENMRNPRNEFHFEEGKEHYGPVCRDYFWLLSRLVDGISKTYFQDCLDNPTNHLVDFNDLIIRIKNSVLNREIFEKRHSNIEDLGLIGLMNLMTVLLKHRPSFQTSKEALEFVDRAFDLLFGLPTPATQNLPKCKSIASRSAAYDLLVELVKGVPENYNAIHARLLEQHIAVNRSVYPWDYWPHEDGRSESGYVGLTNLGATCYMASCLQHIYMMPKVRAAVLKAHSSESESKHFEILKELQKMFTYLYESEKKAYNPRNFCKVYTMDNQPLNTGEQKDMAEFFIDLVSKLEEMTPELKSVCKELFCGVLSNNVVSLDCNHVSRNDEDFYTVRCQVADMRSLYESLNEVTVKDTLEGDNMYTCSQCGKKVRAEKRACFKQLPEILCFNTMRYTFNMITMLKEKVNTHFSFPMQLNMECYMEKKLMPQHYKEEKEQQQQQQQQQDLKSSVCEQYDYDLIGVTVHTGNADGGHYYSFIKERTSDSDKWLFFNDAEVKPFDPSQIPTECFGGEINSKTYDSVAEKFMELNFEKSNSAYMLFYERRRRPQQQRQSLRQFTAEVVTQNNSCAGSPTVAELSECATTVNGDSLSSEGSPLPVSLPFEISQDLEEWIWNDNMQFIRDKNIFDHSYFSFMWQISGVLPQSILPLQSNVTKLATQLSTSFFLETFIHSKEKPTMVQWVELITKQFNSCHDACGWFLDHMAKDTWWPIQILIKCPNQIVRQMFQRLCIHVIQKLKPTHHEIYLSVDGDVPFDLLNVEPNKIGNSSPVTRFIKSLLKLMENGARVHLKHLSEYFGFLTEFSRMGEEETKFLIAAGAINTMVQFYLGNKFYESNDFSDFEEEDEEVVPMPIEKHKPASLDRMITLVANLVEKSRGTNMKLQLPSKDYCSITGGKGFPFIYHQIKDNINLQQSRNLIHSLCKDNETLAIQIVNMMSQAIISTKNADTNQTFFKVFTLITEAASASTSGDTATFPSFTQLILQKVWEAADHCPHNALEWLSSQVTRSKLVHQWVLQSMSKWVERFLLEYNNQRVRTAAAYLILSLIPNQNFRLAFRSPQRVHQKDPVFTEEALNILHEVFNYLLKLLSNAKAYADTQLHGTSKLTAYFGIMTYFLISRKEKLMLIPHFENLWSLYHPLLSEPPISTYHNKQAFLLFWYNACIDCTENVQCIVQNDEVWQHIPFNYIYADHDNQDVVIFNRTMLPAYYGLLRMCCEQSREFTRNLANHSNINWAFTNIASHPTQYNIAVDELFKLMNLIVTIHDDATEQEKKEISDFKHEMLLSYMKALDYRTAWSTIITAFQILITTNEERSLVIKNNGLQMLFDTFQTLHMMYHEATACHVTSDLLDLLSVIVNLLDYVRCFCTPKESRSLLVENKEWFEVLKKLASLLNTYNSSEMRILCIKIMKYFLLIIPNEVINLLVPIISHSHNTSQQDGSMMIPLGPYYPRQGHKVPLATAKNIVRPARPMIQMSVPSNTFQITTDAEHQLDLFKLYAPYHEFIDLLCRVAVNINCFSDNLVMLNIVIGFEALPLKITYFSKFWMEINRNDEFGHTYVQTLVSMPSFVEYIDSVLVDNRKFLLNDCIFEFLKVFLPKIDKGYVANHIVETVELIRNNLTHIIDSSCDRATALTLIGDLRSLFLIFSNFPIAFNVPELKQILKCISDKLSEITGNVVTENSRKERSELSSVDENSVPSNNGSKSTSSTSSSSMGSGSSNDESGSVKSSSSNSASALVRKIVTISLPDRIDTSELENCKELKLTIMDACKELQFLTFDNIQLFNAYEQNHNSV